MEKYYESPAIKHHQKRKQILNYFLASSVIIASLAIYRVINPSQDVYLTNGNNSNFIYVSKNSNLYINSILDNVSRNGSLEDKLTFKENKQANYQIQPLEYIPIEIQE